MYIKIFLWLVRNMIMQSIRSRAALIIEMARSWWYMWAPCLPHLIHLFAAIQSALYYIVRRMKTTTTTTAATTKEEKHKNLKIWENLPASVMINIKTSLVVVNWMTHLPVNTNNENVVAPKVCGYLEIKMGYWIYLRRSLISWRK